MGTSKEAFGHDRLNAAGIAKGNRLDGCFCLHKKTLSATVSGSVFCFFVLCVVQAIFCS